MPVLRHLAFLLFSLPTYAVTLHGVIRHEAEKQPLLLDSLRYHTSAGETYSITRASWLMSGFALQRTDGIWLELPGQVAWIDALKKRTQFAIADVPAGRYSALRFHVGIDAATNALNPARYAPDHPLNPSVCGLHWSWQGGYIFLALEGGWRGANGPPGGFSADSGAHQASAITLPCRTIMKLCSVSIFSTAVMKSHTLCDDTPCASGVLRGRGCFACRVKQEIQRRVRAARCVVRGFMGNDNEGCGAKVSFFCVPSLVHGGQGTSRNM
jgi:hypothetical protein